MEEDNTKLDQLKASTSAPQPEPAPPSTSEPSHDASKKPKTLVATAIICAILAIAGIAVSIYFYIDANNKAADIAELQSKLDLLKEETSAELVEKQENDTIVTTVETELFTESEKAVRELIEQLNSATQGLDTRFIKVYDYNVRVKNPAAKTLLPLQKTYGLYSDKDMITDGTIESVTNAIKNKLSELGFVNNTDIEGPFYLTGGTNLVNREKEIACNVSESIPYSVSCGHLSWMTEDYISEANEFAEAVYAVDGGYPYSLNLKKTITDSSVKPYQRVTIAVGNAAGLFYRSSPEEKWRYFTSAQSAVPCDEYNTTDLKNAFAGTVCYDEEAGGQSTVQP